MIGSQRGFALIITLIVTALLVALVTEFITDVYVDTSARQSYLDGQQASLLADSGVSGGLALLKYSLAGQSYSSLQDRWAKPIEIAEERGTLRVTIEEESGKLSLNHIYGANGTPYGPKGEYQDIAQRLLKKQGLSLDLLDALADWVDNNDEPHPGGAETPYYAALKPAYAAKNGPLDTLEELRLVKGFSREAFARLQPFVTVYSVNQAAPPLININTAPKEVIMALDDQLTDSLAAQILDQRKTTPFKSPGELTNVSGMGATFGRIQGFITTSGSIYRLRAEAQVNGTTRIIETVVTGVTGAKPVTLYWREY
jgi:general secretion pathway protein K